MLHARRSYDVTAMARAGRPELPVPVPGAVAGLAAGDAIEPVWCNELGGLTFRIGAGTPDERFVKWAAHGTPEIDLAAEATRLAWLKGRAAVPDLLDHGADEEGEWLATAAVRATSAVEPPWAARPATAAAAIGSGLRRLHDSLGPEECPFSWSLETRLSRVEELVAHGESPPDLSPEHRHLTVAGARDLLSSPPPIDRLVVCHGDPCAPNTLIANDGTFAAHVDMGRLGVADRWADLAVAAWSTEWNYGPGYATVVYDAYGIAPDTERIAYYRLLWDLA